VKTWQHILFWAAVYGFLTWIIGHWFKGYVESFYYVSMLLPVVIATSYFFNYFLVPSFLFTRRFFLFGLYTYYMLVVSLCLELFVSVLAMLLIIRFGIRDSCVLITDVFILAGLLYFVVLFTSFLLLIKHYYLDQGAINRLKEQQEKMKKGYLTVRANRKDTRIEYDDLLYIESLADYIHIQTVSGEVIVSKQKISHIEKELPDLFFRIHRSFIVNTTKISSFTSEEMMLGETELPISRSYRKEVMYFLKSRTSDKD
jgi:two-component system response regulator LytT